MASHTRITPQVIADVRQKWNKGLTVRNIAWVVGIGEDSVREIIGPPPSRMASDLRSTLDVQTIVVHKDVKGAGKTQQPNMSRGEANGPEVQSKGPGDLAHSQADKTTQKGLRRSKRLSGAAPLSACPPQGQKRERSAFEKGDDEEDEDDEGDEEYYPAGKRRRVRGAASVSGAGKQHAPNSAPRHAALTSRVQQPSAPVVANGPTFSRGPAGTNVAPTAVHANPAGSNQVVQPKVQRGGRSQGTPEPALSSPHGPDGALHAFLGEMWPPLDHLAPILIKNGFPHTSERLDELAKVDDENMQYVWEVLVPKPLDVAMWAQIRAGLKRRAERF